MPGKVADERKLVSVVFADVVESTAIGSVQDPEVVRAVMDRYFARMREIAEAHGGSVEKYAGDAVMVVFGIPRAHGDDAERAVRAALAMRDCVPDLNAGIPFAIQVRLGVDTGQAMAAVDRRDQVMVTGDVVNMAARLEQSARPGEVLIGPLTRSLTAAAIECEDREPLTVHGRRQPLAVFAAVRARSPLPAERATTAQTAPLVGREEEIRLLLDTYERVRATRRPHLVTLVGPAGVGKTRLVAEAVARMAGDPAVLRGRCLPYGPRITWWPFAEMVRGAAGIEPGETRDEAAAKLDRRLASLRIGAAERTAVRARLGFVLGLDELDAALPDVGAGALPAELGWGVRAMLDAMSAPGPAVAVLDDLQWAEPPLVEALGRVVGPAREGRLLVLCVGREEFLEAQTAWGGGLANSTTIGLGALSRGDTAALVRKLAGSCALAPEVRRHVVEASGGTPLFCEEFVRLLCEERQAGEQAMALPATVQALLSARIDGLEPEAKRALQAASVIGDVFTAQDLEAIAGPEAAASLQGLVRRGLLTWDRGGPGLRFDHPLVREAAYEALPKVARAQLHEAFSALAACRPAVCCEYPQVGVYHAAAAFRLSRDLLLDTAVVRRRAERLLELALAGAETAARGSDPEEFEGVVALAEEASGPARASAAQAARLAVLRGMLLDKQGAFQAALETLDAAAGSAREAGLPGVAGEAMVAAADLEAKIASNLDAVDRRVAQAIELFTQAGDERGRLRAQIVGSIYASERGQFARMVQEGPGLAARARALELPMQECSVLSRLGTLAVNQGRPDRAQSYLRRSAATARSHGYRLQARTAEMEAGRVRWLVTGDARAWEQACRSTLEAGEQSDYPSVRISARRYLGQALWAEGRLEEAERVSAVALAESVATGERFHRVELSAQCARLALRRGDLASARRLAGEATQAARWDVSELAESALAEAEVLEAEGRLAGAERELRAALGSPLLRHFWGYQIDLDLALARVLARRGRREEAARLLDEQEAALDRAGYRHRTAQVAELRALIARRKAS